MIARQEHNHAAESAKPLTRDPQFWIATVVALVAVGFLVRSLLPKFGIRFSKGASSKATLTVGGKAIKK